MNKYIPLLKIVSLSILALTIVLIFGCSSSEDRAVHHMHKAEKLYADGELVKAQLEARNAVQIRQNYIEAWVLLGRIQVDLENWKGALTSFNQALLLDKHNLPSLLGRSSIFLSAGLLTEAQEDIEQAAAIRPEDSDVLLQKARFATVSEKSEQAIQLAKDSLNADQDNTEARILLATLLYKTGDIESAMGLLDEGIKRDPGAVDVKRALAIMYRETGNSVEELKLLKELAESENDPEVIFLYASALKHFDRVDDAEQVLRGFLAKEGDDKIRQRIALALVDLFEATQSPDRVEKSIKSLVIELNNAPLLLLRLAGFQYQQGKTEEATAIYRKIIEQLDRDHFALEARKRLAGLYLGRQDYESAKKLIDEVLATSKRDNEALAMRGALAMRENRFADAISDFRILSQDQPTDPAISEKLTRAYLAQGNIDLAINQMKQFIDAAPNELRGYTALSELYTRLGRYDDARTVLLQLLDVLPDNPIALTRLVHLESKSNDLDKALFYAKRLRDSLPDQAHGHYLLGQIYQMSGDHRRAIESFNEALRLAPDWIEPLTARVNSRLTLGESKQATKELQDLLKEKPANFAAHNLLGELRRGDGELVSALSSFARAIEQNPKWPIPYLNSADLKIRLGKPAEAIQLLERAEKNTNVRELFSAEIKKLRERAKQISVAR